MAPVESSSSSEAGSGPGEPGDEAGSGCDGLTPEELQAAAAEFEAWSPQHLHVGKVARALKRQQHSCIANYILSIHEDAEFVALAHRCFRELPLLANLRAGAWYVRPEDSEGTCYFKSTDGHAGQWDFSAARLNLHVAALAASRGGVLLVDSTRRGKSFPDSLSKTVPIWCAVLSAALDRAAGGDCASPAPCLHLPPWVPASERDQIEQQLPRWLERLSLLLPAPALLEAVGVAGPSRLLRPFWLCPGDEGDLTTRAREVAELARRKGVLPVVCISASRVKEPAEQRELHSWAYIQGAGDDDENWAARSGLTPQRLWHHFPALLAAARRSEEAAAAAVAGLPRAAPGRQCPGGAEGSAAAGLQGSGNQEPPGDSKAPAQGATAPTRAAADQEATADGCWTIGPTGLAVGAFGAGAPPGVWEKFDAVLNCGAGAEHAGMRGDPRYCAVAVAAGKRADPTKDWWQVYVLPRALAFISRHLGRRVLIHCERGDTRAPALAAAALCAFFGGGAGDPPRKLAAESSPVSKDDLRRALAEVQRYHPYCAVPRRIMQQLNLFFVTTGGGWSRWSPEAAVALLGEEEMREGEGSHGDRSGCGVEPAAGPPVRWCADEILPSLLLGTAAFAGSLTLLRERGVTHIVNVTSAPCGFPEDFQYWHVPIEDDRRAQLLPLLDGALGFMRAALAAQEEPSATPPLQRRHTVLVHCREGASRSVAVLLAYLVRFEGLALGRALELVRARRPPEARTQPNAGFMAQLRAFEAAEHASLAAAGPKGPL